MPQSWWSRGLLLMMTAAITVNVVQFPIIDEAARHNYKALFAYETRDIFEIAIARDNSARHYVGPFHYLGQQFPHATIIVPHEGVSSWFELELSVLVFGKAQAVERVAYDAQRDPEGLGVASYRFDLAAHVPSRGATQRVLDERVAFYVDDEWSGAFMVFLPEGQPGRTGAISFVDPALLDRAVSASEGSP
jgi:hypothetical protein